MYMKKNRGTMGKTNLGQLRDRPTLSIPLRSRELNGYHQSLLAGLTEKAVFFLRRPGMSMFTLHLSSGLIS